MQRDLPDFWCRSPKVVCVHRRKGVGLELLLQAADM
jgi:hypothetical protein